MLEQNKEMLIAKIIGLLNGLDGEGAKFKEEDILKKALNAIKNNQSLDEYIAFFEEKKKEYLPNCLSCQSPCGRSNDYYISRQADVRLKEEMLKAFLNNYNASMLLDEVVYQLIKLSW